ncbi:hypothetical protein [Salana multivorans]|uniref:hypothetical protein n=1 Tax=Salana multivorans TaxID=120377 RepID=UPI000A8F4836|nr:hypothetical protein [Salana multivorans]
MGRVSASACGVVATVIPVLLVLGHLDQRWVWLTSRARRSVRIYGVAVIWVSLLATCVALWGAIGDGVGLAGMLLFTFSIVTQVVTAGMVSALSLLAPDLLRHEHEGPCDRRDEGDQERD